MKNSIIIFFTILTTSCSAQKQSQGDSLSNMLNRIDNSSVKMATAYAATTLYLDENALEVCNRLSGNIADRLIDELSNKEKALVYHVILSGSTEPFNAKLKSNFHYVGDSIDYTEYTYNNFTWKRYSKKKEFEIDEAEIKKIRQYWEGKKGKLRIFHKCL